MRKKKKHFNKNKSQKEKDKENEKKIRKLKLLELKTVIYTYDKNKLLNYFWEEFKYGQGMDHYETSVSLIYNLDIECIEFAIARFTQIDNNLDPDRRYLNVIMPLFAAFLIILSDFGEEIFKYVGLCTTIISIFAVMYTLNKDRKQRGYANTMLKTFEQVHARKQKEKE
ncbi:hypothetical protein P4U47_18575 [Bacillus altitudinis]|uniref:hypothetical protein n=1 Tax=Bacillus altitudinis TaxID=293387 RepID=UPI002E208DF2|nr:hypothetical protein [Bacillus altitudinis]